LPIIDEDAHQSRELQQELLRLALVEVEDALAELVSANASLGTGMSFTLGAGTVMF
jgi:hypothetical protein